MFNETYKSGDGDSGILRGFWPRNPYVEERELARAVPPEILQAHPAEEVQEYYGFDHVPTLTECYRYDASPNDR